MRFTTLLSMERQNKLKLFKMDSRDLHKVVMTDASPKEVMKRITQVNLWWSNDFEGRAEKLNDKFTVRFGTHGHFDFKIIDAVPDKKITWLVTGCYMPVYKDTSEWKNTKVVFDLSEIKGKTRIQFTHQGITPEVECYEDCEYGWDLYIGKSLPKLIKTGKGDPYTG